MRRMLAISLLTLCLSTSAFAGDVPSPGKQPPPPCTENCTTTTTSSATTTDIVIEIVSLLIALRP